MATRRYRPLEARHFQLILSERRRTDTIEVPLHRWHTQTLLSAPYSHDAIMTIDWSPSPALGSLGIRSRPYSRPLVPQGRRDHRSRLLTYIP